MICYKDITFCKFYACQHWASCCRALTEEIKAAAEKWWAGAGGNAEDTPIAVYCDKPECFISL